MNTRVLFTLSFYLLFYALAVAQNNVSTTGKYNTVSQEEKENFIQIKPIKFNSNSADIYPRFLEDGLIFSSNRGKKKKPNYDFYVISDLSNPELEKLTGKMRTNYNETSIYASKRDNIIYFSRNKKAANIAQRNRKSKIKLWSFTVQKNGEKWRKIKELPFNSHEYSVAHISLNASENKLYFVSDMKEGYGGMDIYQVDINQDGTYSEPKNLGPTINTTANETSPFLVGDDILYFASDNPKGLGGLDIFKINLVQGEAINLGEPLNSNNDDYGLIVNDKYVFFTSNRDQEAGNDNIYSITPKELKTLEENLTRQNLENIADNDGTIKGTNQKDSDAFGNVKSNNLNQQESTKTTTKPYFKLDEDYASLERVILFGFDNTRLKLEYQDPLDNLVSFLEKHEQVRVILIGHTDQIGDQAYNLNLSEKRAITLKEYLIANGVIKNRIITIGEGERKPTENCNNCTKAQNQQNRRVEIKLEDK